MNVTITEFKNRRSPTGEVKEYSWIAFKKRLKQVKITDETVEEYANSMTNEQRTNCKDVGGFVGGVLKNGRRLKSQLVNRTIVTIDADDARSDDVDAFELMHDLVYFVHSTHTSTKEHPRLRWVFPLTRPVTPEEYGPLARVFASMIGLDTIDESTDQPERLMFWPSVSLDGDYLTWEGGTILADPDVLLQEIEPEEPSRPTSTTSSGTSEPRVAEVHEGGRNKQVFGYASMLRGAGLDADAIAYAVADYNSRYCIPPLPQFELDTICNSVCSRYDAGDSVMATMRDAYDDFSDMGELSKVEVPTKRKKICLESASALAARNIEPPKFFVDGLITAGITILASPPKFGKSWLCTDFCQSIALGADFLGMKTTKTKVIYLALEDGAYRLKDRGAKVAGTREMPSDLYLALEAPLLQDGLLDELKAQIAALGGGVGVIVIDTLQKVRGVAGRTEGVYGYDYRELGALHQFAINNNIAVVLVHHLNKGGDDNDFVSRLNGSTGISGAADTIITMTRAKRGDKDTRMAITGRDVKERTLVLQMNWSTWRWENLGDEQDVRTSEADSEYENDPIVRVVKAKLDEAEDLLEDTTYENDLVSWECTSAELHEAIVNRFGDSPELGGSTQIGQKARRLADRLMSYDGISYQYGTETNPRAHVFSRFIV